METKWQKAIAEANKHTTVGASFTAGHGLYYLTQHGMPDELATSLQQYIFDVYGDYVPAPAQQIWADELDIAELDEIANDLQNGLGNSY